MEVECINIAKVILPAVRVSIAEQLSSKYKMKQKDIAAKIGIAQVAVSKYLSGGYSRKVGRAVGKIRATGIIDNAAEEIAKADNAAAIRAVVNRVCSKVAYDKLVD